MGVFALKVLHLALMAGGEPLGEAPGVAVFLGVGQGEEDGLRESSREGQGTEVSRIKGGGRIGGRFGQRAIPFPGARGVDGTSSGYSVEGGAEAAGNAGGGWCVPMVNTKTRGAQGAPEEVFMHTGTMDGQSWREVRMPGEMDELVRGSELALVERLRPLVRVERVLLDLSGVERIDAAGIAALVTLYAEAERAGTSFHVANPRRHVAELLGLVGLDGILWSHDTGLTPHTAVCPAECAA